MWGEGVGHGPPPSYVAPPLRLLVILIAKPDVIYKPTVTA